MIWKEKTKKILDEISKLEIIYSKKFEIDYEYDFADSRSNEEILADIKNMRNCILLLRNAADRKEERHVS